MVWRISCGLLPRSQARQVAICGCDPSPPPMLLSLMECDHIYSVPHVTPRPTRRCRDSCSALKLLLPSLFFSSMRPKVGRGRTLVTGSRLLIYFRVVTLLAELPT